MSYVPTPPPPPGAPEPPPGPPVPPRRSRTGPLVLGALISVIATVLGPVPALFLGGSLGIFGMTLLAPLACLLVGVGLLFPASTRPWGLGMLIGFFAMLVVGAGACVLMLAAFSSYGATL